MDKIANGKKGNPGTIPIIKRTADTIAAIKGLEALRRDGSVVELHTDSQYVVKGCSEWLDGWKRNGWRTSTRKPVVNQDLWQIMDALLNKHNVTLKWVKGHAGHVMNERADVLANMGVPQ